MSLRLFSMKLSIDSNVHDPWWAFSQTEHEWMDSHSDYSADPKVVQDYSTDPRVVQASRDYSADPRVVQDYSTDPRVVQDSRDYSADQRVVQFLSDEHS